MLRASYRLLRPGGRLAILTIHPAPGLSERDYRRACRDGPRAVAVRRDHRALLSAAGFVDVEGVDETGLWRRTQAAWHDEAEPVAEMLRAAEGERFDERQQERRTTLAAIDDGLLRRSLFTARRG